MQTTVIKIDEFNMEESTTIASYVIKKGNLVIFPTETVYGVGANALDENSSRKIYEAKGRPSDNPLIVHISSKQELYKIAKNIDDRTEKIIDSFWPGALTIIVEKADCVPYMTTGNLDTVAVRMPSNEIARKIIEKSEVPIAAPSANLSGKPSITSARFIKDDFMGKVDLILLNDDSSIGIESTVIDTTTSSITILRPGYITKSDIESVIGEVVVFDSNITDINVIPKSPGMKYKHYAPECELVIVQGDFDKQKEKIDNEIQKDIKYNIKSTVLGKNVFSNKFDNFISLGDSDIDVAKNIFTTLRLLDKKNIKKAYFLEIIGSELSFSIMDRVKKASSNRFI